MVASFVETWTTTSTAPDGDEDWTKVTPASSIAYNGNAVRFTSSTIGSCRCEVDLDSSDHHATATVTTNEAAANSVGVCVRYSSSDETCYVFYLDDLGSTQAHLARFSTGTETNIISWAESIPTASYTISLEVEGATLRAYLNGALVQTASDSTITGGARIGIIGTKATGSPGETITTVNGTTTLVGDGTGVMRLVGGALVRA